MSHRSDNERLLHRYLEHHLAGAAGGMEHIEHMAAFEPGTDTGRMLRTLADGIRREHERLRVMADRLGVDPHPHVKKGMAWLAEKVARVVTGGRVGSRSPLGRVLDLELMMSAVAGKRALWQALSTLAEIDPRLSKEEIEEGIRASRAQKKVLLELHRSAVRLAFADLRAEAHQHATG